MAQARTPGAEARPLLGPGPVVQSMPRAKRPGSFRKLARGPMESEAKRQNGLYWSMIIQGLDSSMPALGHASELIGST